MNRWSCPKGFREAAETKRRDMELSKEFGVTPETIQNWKKRLGLSQKRASAVDRDLIFSLLKTATPRKEIMARCGCSETTFYRLRLEMFGPQQVVTPRPGILDEDGHVSLVIPTSRRDLAHRAKAEQLGMDLETFKTVWLSGRVGKGWEADMGF